MRKDYAEKEVEKQHKRFSSIKIADEKNVLNDGFLEIKEEQWEWFW